jgi:hypothetical protein
MMCAFLQECTAIVRSSIVQVKWFVIFNSGMCSWFDSQFCAKHVRWMVITSSEHFQFYFLETFCAMPHFEDGQLYVILAVGLPQEIIWYMFWYFNFKLNKVSSASQLLELKDSTNYLMNLHPPSKTPRSLFQPHVTKAILCWCIKFDYSYHGLKIEFFSNSILCASKAY